MGDMTRGEPAHQCYDSVAEEYAARIYGELEHKPYDRAILAAFAKRFGAGLCDAGCGPGHVARLLAEEGTQAFGVDLSGQMVRVAARLNPSIPFVQADLAMWPFRTGSLGGIVAFYSLIHIERAQIVEALAQLRASLRPGGGLLAAFHLGNETLHRDDLWDVPVNLDFHCFQTAEMSLWMHEAGFVVEWTHERDPYPDVEHQSRRGYVLAVNSS